MANFKTLLVATVMVAILVAVPSNARADRWYNSKEAWTAYGFLGGALVGHLLTREFSRPRYPQPVYGGGGYYGQPGYAAPQDTYTIYKEDRIWPFYRRIRAESIPMIQPPPPGRSSARSLANDDVQRPTTNIVNNYYYDKESTAEDAPAPATTEESILDARRAATRTPRMQVVTVSNQAGQARAADELIRERKLQISQEELERARGAAADLQIQLDQIIDRIGTAEQQVQEQMEQNGLEIEKESSARVEASI